MSKFTFSMPIGSIDNLHAALRNDQGEAVTACGITRNIADRNPILLDLIETTCQKCLDAMGWKVGYIPNYFGPGEHLPIKGPPELFHKYGGKTS